MPAVGTPERCESGTQAGRCAGTLRSRIIDAPFWGPLGVLAKAVSGPIGSPETSAGPPRSYSLQCCHWMPGAGCDVAVEEKGRGGAWRGDVLPRWRRGSEEILIPFGLLQLVEVFSSIALYRCVQRIVLTGQNEIKIERHFSFSFSIFNHICLNKGKIPF